MRSHGDLTGLIKFLARDDWKSSFEEVLGEHFGPAMQEFDLEYEAIGAALGGGWDMALWGVAFEGDFPRNPHRGCQSRRLRSEQCDGPLLCRPSHRGWHGLCEAGSVSVLGRRSSDHPAHAIVAAAADVALVPEPGTSTLLAVGFIGLLVCYWAQPRRKDWGL